MGIATRAPPQTFFNPNFAHFLLQINFLMKIGTTVQHRGGHPPAPPPTGIPLSRLHTSLSTPTSAQPPAAQNPLLQPLRKHSKTSRRMQLNTQFNSTYNPLSIRATFVKNRHTFKIPTFSHPENAWDPCTNTVGPPPV